MSSVSSSFLSDEIHCCCETFLDAFSGALRMCTIVTLPVYHCLGVDTDRRKTTTTTTTPWLPVLPFTLFPIKWTDTEQMGPIQTHFVTLYITVHNFLLFKKKKRIEICMIGTKPAVKTVLVYNTIAFQMCPDMSLLP